MKHLSIRILILTIFLSFLVSLSTFKIMSEDVIAEELKIGVVDISGVFNGYEKRKDHDQKLKDMEINYKSEIEKQRKEMINLNEETQLLDLGSESIKKNIEILERKRAELDGFVKFADRQLMKRYKEFFELIYDDVVKEVDVIGKEGNYSLIIKKEEPELKSSQISDLQYKIGIRTVLYHSNVVDITSNVIERLNARYQKEKEKRKKEEGETEAK